MNIWSKQHNFAQVGYQVDIRARSMGTLPLIRCILEDKLNKQVTMLNGGGATYKKLDYFLSEIEKLSKMKCVYTEGNDSFVHKFYASDDSFMDFTCGLNSSNNYANVEVATTTPEYFKDFIEYVDDVVEPPITTGSIFAIVQHNGRLSLDNIGMAGLTLVKENYNDSVLSDYNEAVQDLRSSTPSGRIVILEGPPGTGKTHLIKSFLMDVPDAMFVLIPPDMVASLAGPELLQLLIANKEEFAADAPIILLLEDADRCLVVRQNDNISSIQSLLNLGDGILGSMLDLRIIATTNAKKLEMEGALLRPGRLSKRIEVAPLKSVKARELLSKLCPDLNSEKLVSLIKADAMLAEVYSIARKNGWVPPAKNDKKTRESNNEGRLTEIKD